MLAAAILVCIAGLMFTSDRFATPALKAQNNAEYIGLVRWTMGVGL